MNALLMLGQMFLSIPGLTLMGIGVVMYVNGER